jgi:hypothetical protein
MDQLEKSMNLIKERHQDITDKLIGYLAGRLEPSKIEMASECVIVLEYLEKKIEKFEAINSPKRRNLIVETRYGRVTTHKTVKPS